MANPANSFFCGSALYDQANMHMEETSSLNLRGHVLLRPCKFPSPNYICFIINITIIDYYYISINTETTTTAEICALVLPYMITDELESK